ncbi:MAG: hypothetical protein E6J41_06995 [Chloroflexi bacterium]|nr:MAG: hypothetical protein E6J41_06995 [Chloroflexota bacterium]
MTLRLLSSGVDTLIVTARGGVRSALLVELEAGRKRARHEGGPVPFELGGSGCELLLKPYGWSGYRYWLASPELELWVGAEEGGAGGSAGGGAGAA